MVDHRGTRPSPSPSEPPADRDVRFSPVVAADQRRRAVRLGRLRSRRRPAQLRLELRRRHAHLDDAQPDPHVRQRRAEDGHAEGDRSVRRCRDGQTRPIVVRGPLVPGQQPPDRPLRGQPAVTARRATRSSSCRAPPTRRATCASRPGISTGTVSSTTRAATRWSTRSPRQEKVRAPACDGRGRRNGRRRAHLTVTPAPKAKAGFLSPSPVVTLSGPILSTGARVKLLSVRAPRGALVAVGCRGKGCPARSSGASASSAARCLQDLRALPARGRQAGDLRPQAEARSATSRATRSGPGSSRCAPTGACRPGKRKPAKSCA